MRHAVCVLISLALFPLFADARQGARDDGLTGNALANAASTGLETAPGKATAVAPMQNQPKAPSRQAVKGQVSAVPAPVASQQARIGHAKPVEVDKRSGTRVETASATPDVAANASNERRQLTEKTRPAPLPSTPLSPEQRARILERRLDASALAKPYQPSMLTPVPRVDCPENERPAQVGDRWQCVERGSRSRQGSSMWVASVVSDVDLMALVHFINPGNAANDVRCLVFDRNGRLKSAMGSRQVINPGGIGTCVLRMLPDDLNSSWTDSPNRDLMWILLVADRPILPHVFGDGSDRRPLDLYPIDCSDAAGVEFACQFAIGAPAP